MTTVPTAAARAAQARARADFAGAFSTLGYEVLPFKGTAEKVVRYVPRTVRLTVTASPRLGIDRTMDLADELSRNGYSVAPHLSARLIRDRGHLADLVARAADAGITSAFVVGGDGDQIGDYSDAGTLLRHLHGLEHGFTDIGIGGYPEGHVSITHDDLQRAMLEKAPMAHHVVTQICFDAAVTIDWARRCRQAGLRLPILVGMPGAVSRQKLLRISAATGVGDSARFLHKQHSMLWRFFRPGGYRPDGLLRGLRPTFGYPDNGIAGFHIFTFNDLERTEQWRQQLMRRYSGGGR